MKPDTQCVHAGTHSDRNSGGINTPIYTSSAYHYLDTDTRSYPRYFNIPNQRAVVEKLCALEMCEDGIVFGSGMAAISTVMLTFLKHGDHAVIQEDIYGGTHTFVIDILAGLGVGYTFASSDANAIIEAINEKTKLVYIETPTNPILKIIDIRKVALGCQKKGVVSVIDNTFASPINQIPSACGVDIIIHSGTKYLAGHSDLCCGIAVGTGKAIASVLRAALSFGGCLDAQACSILERSMKTLSLRVKRQTENAGTIAKFLSEHPMITSVNYPGLPAFPGHSIAKEQMSGFGAMLSFVLSERAGSAHQFMKRLKLIAPAISLGGVETTICDPVSTSHRHVAENIRDKCGITRQLLRLSVGVEDCSDLIDDLEGAFLM